MPPNLTESIRGTLLGGLTCLKIVQIQDESWDHVDEEMAAEAKAWIEEQEVEEEPQQGLQTSKGLKPFTDRGYSDG